MSDNITLIIKEGEKIKIRQELKNISELIKGILEENGINEEIPIEQITKQTLENVIQYAEYHHYTNSAMLPCPLPSSDMSLYTSQWDYSFLTNLSEQAFNDLLVAADYLQIKSLLDLLLGFIASKIKDKDIESLRTMYNIEETLTPDLEDEILKEFSWIFTLSKRPLS